MLGRLTWDAIPFNEPLPLLSGAVVGLVILAILVTVTLKGPASTTNALASCTWRSAWSCCCAAFPMRS
jgi:hypothetical protein